MKEYTCEWTMTVYADSPQEAVNRARAVQLNPANNATHFTVFDDNSGECIGDFNAEEKGA